MLVRSSLWGSVGPKSNSMFKLIVLMPWAMIYISILDFSWLARERSFCGRVKWRKEKRKKKLLFVAKWGCVLDTDGKFPHHVLTTESRSNNLSTKVRQACWYAPRRAGVAEETQRFSHIFLFFSLPPLHIAQHSRYYLEMCGSPHTSDTTFSSSVNHWKPRIPVPSARTLRVSVWFTGTHADTGCRTMTMSETKQRTISATWTQTVSSWTRGGEKEKKERKKEWNRSAWMSWGEVESAYLWSSLNRVWSSVHFLPLEADSKNTNIRVNARQTLATAALVENEVTGNCRTRKKMFLASIPKLVLSSGSGLEMETVVQMWFRSDPTRIGVPTFLTHVSGHTCRRPRTGWAAVGSLPACVFLLSIYIILSISKGRNSSLSRNAQAQTHACTLPPCHNTGARQNW